MEKKKAIFATLSTVLLGALVFGAISFIKANDTLMKTKASTQVLVLDESNAPLRGGSGESVVNTLGGGDLTIRYEAPSLKENGVDHFTCWGSGLMKNYLPIKGITEVTVEAKGKYEVMAGRTYGEYQDFIYSDNSSAYGTITLEIPETADYFCIKPATGELYVKKVTITCDCVASGEWAEDDDLLLHSTHVYHQNEIYTSGKSIRTQRQSAVTNGSSSALKVFAESGGAWPQIVFDVPGFNSLKYEYAIDVKLVSGNFTAFTWSTIESGNTSIAITGTFSANTWTTVYLSKGDLEGTKLRIGFDNSTAVEMYLDNLRIRTYNPVVDTNFTTTTNTKYDFSTKVTFEYKIDNDTDYLAMLFGSWNPYIGRLYFKNGSVTTTAAGSENPLGVTFETLQDGFTRVVMNCEKINRCNASYNTPTSLGIVHTAFNLVAFDTSTATSANAVVRNMVFEAGVGLENVAAGAIQLYKTATDPAGKTLTFDYKLPSGSFRFMVYASWSNFFGNFTLTPNGMSTARAGVTVTDSTDGFKTVTVVFDDVDYFANGIEQTKPDTITHLYIHDNVAGLNIRRIFIGQFLGIIRLEGVTTLLFDIYQGRFFLSFSVIYRIDKHITYVQK